MRGCTSELLSAAVGLRIVVSMLPLVVRVDGAVTKWMVGPHFAHFVQNVKLLSEAAQ